MHKLALGLTVALMPVLVATAAPQHNWAPKKITLEAMLAKSRIIVVADPEPANDEIISPEPCLAVSHAYKIRAVIRNLTNVPTVLNSHIKVQPYLQYQMKNRCGKNGYVRTFAQEQYVPIKPPGKTEPAILFLSGAFRGLFFNAIDSQESATRLNEVVTTAPLRCQEIEAHYREFLQPLSLSCSNDSDCSAYDYNRRLAGCEAEVYRKHTLPGPIQEFMALLNTKALKVCSPKLMECEKLKVLPACRRGACLNLIREPDPEMFTSEGMISNSCAPWDGPALVFRIPLRKEFGGEDAAVNISIYADFPVEGKPYSFSWGGVMSKLVHGTNSTYSANYCSGLRSCLAAESGQLTIEKYGGETTSSHGEFTLKFKNGRVIHGETTFKPVPKSKSRVMCG